MESLTRTHIEALLGKLISIPSINPNLAPENHHNEMALARYVRDWLLEHQIKAQIEEVQPGRPNVYAEIGDDEGPVLCLCAHLDTVGVEEMTIPPFQPTVIGNQMYGRGSCDMKGGLAAGLSAALALSQVKFKGRLILALVCDEEYASIGADAFVQKHRADACILTEPSDLKMVISHKGFLWGKVRTSGKSAHGSRWEIGQSAISKMGPVLVALDEFDRNILRKRADALVGPASMHVSLIQGGTGISTYASECTIQIERRTLPAEHQRDVQQELEKVIRGASPDARIEWAFYRPPFCCDPKEPIAQCVQQAYAKATGRKVETVGWGVWTDAAIFQQAGVPTVNLGPSGFGLHEPVEWVDIDSVVQTAAILFDAAKTFFA